MINETAEPVTEPSTSQDQRQSQNPRRQVANRPIYVALAVTAEGTRDILGLWAGDGGEGANHHWDQIAKALKPVYTAPTEAAAEQRFLEFAETWGEKYPAIVKLWETPGPSSSRSWPSTPRSAPSSARPTPSRA